MSRDAFPQIALVVLVALVIVVGLITVGGPGAGREERRDRARMSDLRDLSRHTICIAQVQGGNLPEALVEDASCTAEKRLNDPFTDAPYIYTRVSDIAYRLCADFEAPERLTGNSKLDRETGCVQFNYAPPTKAAN